jgi:hypothetical protein
VDGGPHLPGEGDVEQDLRFGSFGPIAQQLRHAVFDAEQAAQIDEALRVAVERCGQADGDPLVDLAMALCPPAFDAKPLVIVADPGLERFGQWWSRATSAVTCKPATDGPSHVSRGLSCSVSMLGDEAALQSALHADPPPWVVFLRNDRATSEVTAVRNATRSLIARAGLPSFDVRLMDTRPSTVLASAWVCLEAALAVAVAVGVEPLTMIPGEDLRARLDSGGGRPD